MTSALKLPVTFIGRIIKMGVENIIDRLQLPDALPASEWQHNMYTLEQMKQFARDAVYEALSDAQDAIEEYKIPVGNSAAGEMACEWTYDALKDIRDEIVSWKQKEIK